MKLRCVDANLRVVVAVGLFAVLAIPLAATPPYTEDVRNLLEYALQTSTHASNELCAYSMRTSSMNGHVVQERFDPYFGNDKAWSLVSIDGNAPNAEQLDLYEPPLRERHPAVVSFQFIDIASLKFIEETGAGMLFSFDVVATLRHKSLSAIENTLVFDPVTEQVKQIRRVSDSDFRVGKFAKIFEFEAVSTFRRDNETKSTVLWTSTTRLKSRIGREVIDQELHIEFDELDCSTVPVETTELQNPDLNSEEAQNPRSTSETDQSVDWNLPSP